MKIESKRIIGLAALLFAGALSANAQQTEDGSGTIIVDPKPWPNGIDLSPYVLPREFSILRFGVDPITFEFLDSNQEDIPLLNSPEEIEARRLSILRLLDPDEYFRQFPKTEEQVRLEQEADAEIAAPVTPEQRAAAQTPEQNALDQQAIAAMLAVKPVVNPDDAPNAPGVTTASVQEDTGPTTNP
ncbi:MAG: hypothetical protein L0387_36985 [Acidobacteria bacterium]|nr:hypothetical protein [Acidobacteriota bacterium]